MSIGIVELLEMVDIDNGNGILLVQGKQRLIEGAASANAGEFVVIRENVRRFNQRGGEDKGSGRDIGIGSFADRRKLKPQENRDYRPDKAGLDWPAVLKKALDEQRDGRSGT